MKKITFLLLTLFALCWGSSGAQQLTVLYNFNNYEEPEGSLIMYNNVMYGATEDGGINGRGNVFSINRDGSNYITLWSFDDTGSHPLNSNGEYPYGALTRVNGKLYGATYDGGANGYGELYCINLNGTGYKDLWDFDDTGTHALNSNGEYPFWGAITYLNGKFYGMAYEGGANSIGMIFSIDTLGHHFRDLMDFAGTANGSYPWSMGLTPSANGKVLYGLTYSGGTSNDGVAFSIDTNGTHYKKLYDFNSADGTNPAGDLTLVGDKLYGTTYYGASYNYGGIFCIDTSGTNFRHLIDFSGANGEEPEGEDLLIYGKKIYGMAYEGGTNNLGTIFSLDTDGSAFNVLLNLDNTTGTYPNGCNFIQSGDTLYAMMYEGGNFNDGTIIQFVDTNIDAGVSNTRPMMGNISIYPNPSNGRFMMQMPGINGQVSVKVYNELGQEVYSAANVQHPTYMLDASGLANGIYLYKVISGSNPVGQGKLIIQK